jgi:NAD(P)-dependent dehydrogenase (short-subunit alcohol dehydrogenase family)
LGTSVYTASKSFVEGLVKACSIENYAKGITANALQIGYFDAGLTHRIPAELSKKIESNLPAKRWGKIDELASIVEMLINNAYISGTTVKVNGGAEF